MYSCENDDNYGRSLIMVAYHAKHDMFSFSELYNSNYLSKYVSLSISRPDILSQYQASGLSQAGASLVLQTHDELPLAMETPAGVHLQLGRTATGVGGDKHPRPLSLLLVSYC